MHCMYLVLKTSEIQKTNLKTIIENPYDLAFFVSAHEIAFMHTHRSKQFTKIEIDAVYKIF